YFSKVHENKVYKTFLKLSQVKYHEKGFYGTPEIIKKSKSNLADLQNVRFGFYGGFSKRLGSVNPSVPSYLFNYMEELKTGYHFGTDYTYFVSLKVGLGLRYSVFKTINQ